MPRDANRGRINTDGGRNKREWSPPGGHKIELATANVPTLNPNSLIGELLSVKTVHQASPGRH
jgi:hypothetical protein